MFGDYVFEKTAAQYTKKVLLVDVDYLEEKAHYSETFQAHGFRIVAYIDDLSFRINNTNALNSEEKLAILVRPGVYIPYDIQKKCRKETISFESLFPKLNSAVLRESKDLNLELLTLAYQTDFEEHYERKQTELFLRHKMYAQKNVDVCLRKLYAMMKIKNYLKNAYMEVIFLMHIYFLVRKVLENVLLLKNLLRSY